MKITAQKISTENGNLSSIVGLGVFSYKEKVYLYYRSSNDPENTLHAALSDDGFSFEKQKENVFIKTGIFTKADIKTTRNFSISKHDKYFILTYLWSNGNRSMLEKAYSDNLFSWKYEGNMISKDRNGIIVSDYLFNNQQVMYCVQKNKENIQVNFSRDTIRWEKNLKPLIENQEDLKIESVGCAIHTERGILVIYHTKNRNKYFANMVIFNKDNPVEVLWQAKESMWSQPKEWNGEINFLGIVLLHGMFISYLQVEGKGIFAAVFALHKISDGHSSKDISLRLKRTTENPIIAPRSQNKWEAFNTFNPAAVYDGGKVHILYRAQGYDYVSAIGYASSIDGIHIDERLDMPIYNPSVNSTMFLKPSEVSHKFVSGGGYGGCEDPRITKIDNRYYLTYVSFDGMNPPRIALTSIAASDFLQKLWFFEKPVLISPPGIVDKSAVIFPEKIKGKYVIMHRIYPDILIDFVDSLEFDGTHWLEGKYKISPRPDKWDSRKIGAGAPPVKTKYGWLLIYQSVGEQDSGKYKIGAMLLDLSDPTKVLYRSQSPILEPEESYENNGFKTGVIYPCGAVVIDNTLYVYYGGSDSYVCVATANLEEFLKELRFSQLAKLTKPITQKIL